MEQITKYSRHVPLVGAIAIVVVVFGTIYAVATTVLQMNANWPQTQLAQDGAVKLDGGATPQSLIGSNVDASRSLALFTNIYDKTGRPIAGAGYIEGKIAQISRSALKNADEKAYSTFTWQPKSGVRLAAVVVRAKNYYVVSGRSLAEIDKTVSDVSKLTLSGAVFSAAAIYGVLWMLTNKQGRGDSEEHS